jgi:hypothetical protein
MNKSLAPLLVAVAACFGAGAHAADAAASGAALSHDQAKQAKNQADAQYTAGKDQADANKALNKANCDTAATHGERSACKDVADAQAKKEKAQAKMKKETDEANIKANTK